MAIQSALVTGGAGFIGSHIVETLVAQGTRVAVVDNLSTGFKSNLESLMPAITFHEGDIRDEELLDAATVGAEVVFHEAALVSVPISVDKPIESADINEMGTLKVLDAARRQGCRRVVLASSSAVYGSDPSLPKHEDMKPQPESPYAVQKLVNEYYAGLYARLYDLETVCLRYFNVFGPRQFPTSPYSGVISLFMDWAANGQPPTVFGDGRQTRDFINVKDVVRANLLAASAENAAGRVFNVGRGDAITINALWEAISGLAENEHAPRYEAPRKGDIRHSLASIEKINADLSFTPEIGLLEGLEETYRWYLSTRSDD
ncbi:MAG: SDR family oxidoreductase [Desulfobacterales bacterium]|nr:SDR family oxidoreductase [Desulfobacterales bacterium]